MFIGIICWIIFGGTICKMYSSLTIVSNSDRKVLHLKFHLNKSIQKCTYCIKLFSVPYALWLFNSTDDTLLELKLRKYHGDLQHWIW